MKLLVISDLHIGDHARSADLCPHTLTPEQLIGRDQNFIGDFETFVNGTTTLSDGVEAILITGDISNRAHVAEFTLAGQLFSKIANLFKTTEDKVFFVPGNHDVHWPVMKLEPKEYWKQHRYGPILDSGVFFRSRSEAASTGNMFEEPYFQVWTNEEMCVVGINTASHDNPHDAHHHGLVPQKAIDELNTHLSGVERLQDKLKICLMHHHPIIYSDVIASFPDLSSAVNAENLMSMLAKYSFDMVIHGHKHNPRLNYQTINNAHPCLIFGAGSFSSLLDPVNFNGIPNLFHVIEVKGRDQTTNGIHGKVVSWAYDGKTWSEKIHNSKLPHVEVFGAAATRHEVIETFKKIFESEFKSINVLKWPQIITIAPILDRVNVNLVWNCLEIAAKGLGHEPMGAVSLAKEKWVVLRSDK